MIRTQIQLNENQARDLRREAHIAGLSFAEMIRRCVDYALPKISAQRSQRYALASQVIGRFSADADDIAENHDEYLDDAFA